VIIQTADLVRMVYILPCRRRLQTKLPPDKPLPESIDRPPSTIY